jgi:DNA-directed RNA polymerase specialized sigma24 family protein
MGPAEIGRVIGAPEGTVKARLFRGREILKKLLRDATVQPARA